MAKIVVALGGNALSKDGKATAADQLAVANETASELVKLITAGHTLAIVHGNGPQIGNIILHEEAINTEKTPTMPVDVAGAMSQGQIGYWLQNALRNQLEQLKIKKPIASIVTQVLVSKDDPAFKNPSKPIGPFYTEEEAKKLAKTRGITVKEEAGAKLCPHQCHFQSSNPTSSKLPSATVPSLSLGVVAVSQSTTINTGD